MTFLEFIIKVRDAFYSAVLNAVGSTTFWMTIVTILLASFKVLPWETVLVTAGIFGANRVVNTYTTNGK